MTYSCSVPQENPLKIFGIILPAVARMMDEQKLSTTEAIEALRRFIGKGPHPSEMEEAIARLEAIDNELDLRFMLGQEALRALKWKG
jgi:hypothetical protein